MQRTCRYQWSTGMTTPDVIVIRGAPGSGKSVTAKSLAARFGTGARIEVDTLRAMIIPVEWTNQTEHINVLSLATGLVTGFLGFGHRPVIVVDTFSGDKLKGFMTDLMKLQAGIEVLKFALRPDQKVLRSRVEGRPDDRYKDLSVCEKLNDDIAKHLLPDEKLLDNSALTPEETVDVILGLAPIPPVQT